MPKVFLLSDQPVLLAGFEHVLRNHGFEIVGCCPAAEFAPTLRSSADPVTIAPDTILLDITAGLTFASLGELHEFVPSCPVVLWADALPLELMFKTLEFGVRGIVQRNAQPEQLVDSLRKVAAGELQIGFGTRRGMARSPAARYRSRRASARLFRSCVRGCEINRSRARWESPKER